MSHTTLISLNRVSVGYHRRAILEDINLEVRRGACVGVLGPNGAGKTTLLKTLAGILAPVAGKVQASSFRVGYVPQRESLDPIFMVSSLEVVLMGVCGRIGPGRIITRTEKEWARQCLEQTGTANLARNRFSELSGGQKQRVLISRALANKPELLLLDEPTVGIDAAATEAVVTLLNQLHKDGLTILMVNHDFAALRRSVDEVIWIEAGRIIQGPATEMLNREQLEKYLGLKLG